MIQHRWFMMIYQLQTFSRIHTCCLQVGFPKMPVCGTKKKKSSCSFCCFATKFQISNCPVRWSSISALNSSQFLTKFWPIPSLEVSGSSWGYPRSSSILDRDFPCKLSSYWGTPISGNPIERTTFDPPILSPQIAPIFPRITHSYQVPFTWLHR